MILRDVLSHPLCDVIVGPFGEVSDNSYIFYAPFRATDLVDVYDGLTKTPASVDVDGVRYGIVQREVVAFQANAAPVEDLGLRGCPAFTQEAPYSEDLSSYNIGGLTLDTGDQITHQGITLTAIDVSPTFSYIRPLQVFAVTPGENCYFSFYAKRAGINDVGLLIYDDTAKVEILSRKYYDEIEETSRVLVPYTVPAGCTAIKAYMVSAQNVAYPSGSFEGKIYLGGVNHSCGFTEELPYTPSNGSAVSVVSETGITTFDLDNPLLADVSAALRGPDASGRIEFSFVSNVNSSDLADTSLYTLFDMVGVGGGGLVFLKDGANIGFTYLDTGFNSGYVLKSLTVGEVMTIALDYGYDPSTDSMRAKLTINDVESVPTDFSGSWGADDLRFFYENAVHLGWIKHGSFKVYDTPQWSWAGDEKLVFIMQSKADTLSNAYDVVTRTNAVVEIPGSRYGLVQNTVTEFTENVAPVEDNGLRGCPAFTQYQRRAATFAVNNWVNFNSDVSANGTFQGTNVYRFTPNSTSGVANGCYQTIPAVDNDTVGVRYLIRGTITDFRWRIRLKDSTVVSIFIDLTDGSYTKDAGLDGRLSEYRDGWYEVFIHADALTGAEVNAQVYYGVATPYDDPALWFEICQVNLLNYGSGPVVALPYVNSDETGYTSVVSETGGATNGTSFDLDDAALSNLKDVLRGPDAEGRIEFTFVSNFNSADLPNSSNVNILTCTNGITGLAYFQKTSGGDFLLKSYDGVNVSQVFVALSVGDELKVSVDFDSTGFLLKCCDDQGDKVAFSGSWGSEDLRIFYANSIHAGWIKPKTFKIYDKPSWAVADIPTNLSLSQYLSYDL